MTARPKPLFWFTVFVIALVLVGYSLHRAGILFAPESGEDTRSKIADALRKRGIKLSRTDMENLVDEIAAEVKE